MCEVTFALPAPVRHPGVPSVDVTGAANDRVLLYYMLSRYLSAHDFANVAVAHWGIENNLHWQLDATFGEDQCHL
jgi:predicted transposase YbfD/YdcC